MHTIQARLARIARQDHEELDAIRRCANALGTETYDPYLDDNDGEAVLLGGNLSNASLE